MKNTFILSIVLFSTVFLVGCAEVDLNNQADENVASSFAVQGESSKIDSFHGEKGEFVPLENNEVIIEAASVDDGEVHYFNTTLASGEPVYFFVIQSPDGKLRAAANGCQVCGKALQGFRQEGNQMVCNTCGNKYPLNKIATEKGGCNPAPISPDLKIEDGNIKISLDEFEEIKQFFK